MQDSYINLSDKTRNQGPCEERKQRCMHDIGEKSDSFEKGMIYIRSNLYPCIQVVNKMHLTNTQINSALMGLQHQLATIRMAGSIQSSTEVMQAMQKLVKVPEIMQTMRDLSKEMTRAGIIEEMIEETMDAIEPEELEEEAAVIYLFIVCS